MSCAEEPEIPVDPALNPANDLCCCGERREDHDPVTGRALYNFECRGFEYDEETTLLALAIPDPETLP